MWVFSEIMGLPLEDRKLLIDLGDKLLGNTDPEVVGEELTFGERRPHRTASSRSRARTRAI